MRNGACGGGFRKRKHSLRRAASTCLNRPGLREGLASSATPRGAQPARRTSSGATAMEPRATGAPPTKSILMSWLRHSGVGSRHCWAPATARASSARPIGMNAAVDLGLRRQQRPALEQDRESSRHRPRCLALYACPSPVAHFRRRPRRSRSAAYQRDVRRGAGARLVYRAIAPGDGWSALAADSSGWIRFHWHAVCRRQASPRHPQGSLRRRQARESGDIPRRQSASCLPRRFGNLTRVDSRRLSRTNQNIATHLRAQSRELPNQATATVALHRCASILLECLQPPTSRSHNRARAAAATASDPSCRPRSLTPIVPLREAKYAPTH
jgi:hypothetical protein